MATYVLIHGAGDSAWYWHLVASELRERGNDVAAVDLPCDDESAGLSEYADTVVNAIGDRTELVVVGQSLGAFTAPLVCTRVPVKLLVLLAGMVPSPGETAEEWWVNTGYENATHARNDHDDSAIASSTTTSHPTWQLRRWRESGIKPPRRRGNRGHSES